MSERLVMAVLWTAFTGIAANADPAPLTAEDFAKVPAVSSLSMSMEGDAIVGLIADPSDPYKTAAAYWDLSGEIDGDTISPSHITPTDGPLSFIGAKALKKKRSLWFTVQPYVGALQGCGEGKLVGSTKTHIQKAFMASPYIEAIEQMPSGRTEIGENDATRRCFELLGETQVVSDLPLDAEQILISRRTTKSGTSLFLHNLDTGRESFVTRQGRQEQVTLSERDGTPLVKLAQKLVDGEWTELIMLPDASGEFVIEAPLTTQIKHRFTMNVQVQERQNARPQYYVLTDKFSDKVAAYAYDADNDRFADEAAIAHPDFSITRLIFSRRAQDWGALLGFEYAADVRKKFWLDPELKAIQDALNASFPEKNVALGDMTADRNRILVTVSASNQPPAYFLLQDKQRLISIGASRPWMSETQLGTADLIYYTARDGMKIPGILTVPPGYKSGDPTRGAIIIPHGGPWARDYAAFDQSGWVQYFANRGFVILQPQYRGSREWGRELWMAGDAEWGLKMQDDKDDGAAWLVERGYADADKIVIHGYSYGGFAAIAASVRPEGPFQCAVAGAAVANLTRLGNSWGRNRLQRIRQGHTVDGMDPMLHTDDIDIPILLYHGDHDVRVPLWHARDFYNKIKHDAPESELFVLEEMGHSGIHWHAHHKAMVLTEIERFLETKCGFDSSNS
jgi:dienelactone hydrolase